METTVDLTADIIDVRDIIARVELLEDSVYLNNPHNAPDADFAELKTLCAILAQLVGYGGDEQWRGDWYPSTLIQDKYFEDHARQLLEDCGDIPKDLPHYIAIDWETTAQNIQTDYTPIEIDGTTYWYR